MNENGNLPVPIFSFQMNPKRKAEKYKTENLPKTILFHIIRTIPMYGVALVYSYMMDNGKWEQLR